MVASFILTSLGVLRVGLGHLGPGPTQVHGAGWGGSWGMRSVGWRGCELSVQGPPCGSEAGGLEGRGRAEMALKLSPALETALSQGRPRAHRSGAWRAHGVPGLHASCCVLWPVHFQRFQEVKFMPGRAGAFTQGADTPAAVGEGQLGLAPPSLLRARLLTCSPVSHLSVGPEL